MTTRILVLSGSTRAGSINTKLARVAAGLIASHDVDVSLISLSDYPMPLYDGDWEDANGQPEATRRLQAQFLAHQGVFIANPEYNSAITPLLKNAIDWMSRLKDPQGAHGTIRGRVFAIGSASPGAYGGMRAHYVLRQILMHMGGVVIPETVAVPQGDRAFDEAGHLTNEMAHGLLSGTCKALVARARALGEPG